MKTETREFLKRCMTDVNAFNSQHYFTMTKISDAVQYAWENWEDAITGPHHEGTEKPEFPPKSFIEDWIDNEDFAADGFDEDALDANFFKN